MKQFFDFQSRLIHSWFQAFEVQAATFATISARLPMIAAASTGFGDSHAQHETQVMVTEKLDAASEGAQAGVWESVKWPLKVLTGQTHPTAMAEHMMDVAAAVTRPARRKVLANARRLSALG